MLDAVIHIWRAQAPEIAKSRKLLEVHALFSAQCSARTQTCLTLEERIRRKGSRVANKQERLVPGLCQLGY